MSGNVWQWVQDCHASTYASAPTDGSPVSIATGCKPVTRGGSWYREARDLRSASRNSDVPDYRCNNFGFRVARTL